MKCSDIIEKIEESIPKSYAEEWDNVGLLVGHLDQEVKTVVVSLDPTSEVIDYAISKNADLLITHHPLIFKGVKSINSEGALGRRILKLAENHIAYYAMHTNYDTIGGMAKLAASRLELSDTKVLDETKDGEGIGQIGNLKEEMSLFMLAELVKKKFDLTFVTVYGEDQMKISRVAISPGSGKSEISNAISNGAQVMVTGDIGHHEGLDALEDGMAIIDATHYGLEAIFIDDMESKLKDMGDLVVFTKKCGAPCHII